jgi:hypothetical protein
VGDGIERKCWVVVVVISADVGEWVGDSRSGGDYLGFSVGGVGDRVGYGTGIGSSSSNSGSSSSGGSDSDGSAGVWG